MNIPDNSLQPLREHWTRSFIQQYQRRSELQRLALADAAEDEAAPSSETGGASPARPRAQAAPHDLEELQSGQIRLLSQPEELVWVLTLRAWGGGVWLVVPFSSFSFPATDEEYLLGGGRTKYLDVLQLWNTRTVNALFLRRSWLVDTLASEEIRRAEVLFDGSLTGAAVPEDLLANTGLPIVAADDPRLDYKSESLSRFATLDAADLEMAELCAEAAIRPVANIVAASTPPMTMPTVTAARQRGTALPPKLFSSLPMAAAGRNEVSVCWDFPQSPSTLLARLCRRRRLRAEDLAATRQVAPWCDYGQMPVKAGETPVLLWAWPGNNNNNRHATADALFFHRQHKTLLGTGYALRQHNEGTIVLADWIADEHQNIHSPDDITIFLTTPEKI